MEGSPPIFLCFYYILFLFTIVIVQIEGNEPSAIYPTENQIIFQRSGKIAHQATYYHVRLTVPTRGLFQTLNAQREFFSSVLKNATFRAINFERDQSRRIPADNQDIINIAANNVAFCNLYLQKLNSLLSLLPQTSAADRRREYLNAQGQDELQLNPLQRRKRYADCIQYHKSTNSTSDFPPCLRLLQEKRNGKSLGFVAAIPGIRY